MSTFFAAEDTALCPPPSTSTPTPEEAEIWIDGRDNKAKTDITLRIPFTSRTYSRWLRTPDVREPVPDPIVLTLRKKGFANVAKTISFGEKEIFLELVPVNP